MREVSGKNWEEIARNSNEAALVQILGSCSFPREAIYAAHAELTRREEVPAGYASLKQWQKEIAAKMRDPYTFDELWRKACQDMNDMELASDRAAASHRPPLCGESNNDDDLPF